MRILKLLAVLGLLILGRGIAHAVPCEVKGVGASPNSLCGGSGGAPNPNAMPYPTQVPYALPAQGTDAASINAAFPGIVVWTFQTYGTAMDGIVKQMEDRELYILASHFIANGGNQTALHALAAKDLSATNLVRWQAAFSQAMVTPAVDSYSPTPVPATYNSHPALRRTIKGGGMPPPLPAPSPSMDMTIQEVYLEFRIQPYSTPIGALSNALWFIGTKSSVGKAAAAGWTAGSYFYKAMVWIDPSYGWDLVTTYGEVPDSFGITQFSPPTGQGFVTNPDGSVYDGYGNEIAPPGSDGPTEAGNLPATNYGIPVYDLPYDLDTIWAFWDTSGDCILGLVCP